MGNTNSRYQILRRTQKAIFLDSGIASDDLPAIIKVLGPEVIADYLRLEYIRTEQIPSENPGYKTAGLLDCAHRRIFVSKEFPSDQQRLTGMHEIVHWVLHRGILDGVLHRDRPIDPSSSQRQYNSYESEATRIACLALMPEKLVKTYFHEVFGMPIGASLELDENAAFYLEVDMNTLRGMSPMDKALLVAKASRFGRPVVSLHEFFRVSPTAMAIRLQELHLIAPERRRGVPELRVVR